MKVRIIGALREFDELAPDWKRVTSAGRHHSPFLSHDWFACCWRTAGPHRRRETWILEDGTGPLAFVPLVLRKATIRGFPVRILEFLSAPDTPFVDIPTAAAAAPVVEGFLDALNARSDWDVLSIEKLPTSSATYQTLRAALPGRFPWRVSGVECSPYLGITGSWEEFFRSKTQRFRKTCRNIENRIHREGEVVVEEHRDVDPEGAVFQEAMEVSRLSWKGPRGLAMATMQGMPRFFREFTSRASENGWLSLWLLRRDGRAVATEYQIGADGERHALRADFDATAGELSPGAYLNFRIVRALFGVGDVREYHMGPGANEYKLRWASGSREAARLEIYAPTSYGRLLHSIETRLVPLARRWRATFRDRCA
jgi:CelD/BcsL family acetyltransferase involved in cellulose biosynthesis